MTKGEALVLVEDDATVKVGELDRNYKYSCYGAFLQGNCGNINVPASELSVYVSDDPEVLQVAVKLKVVEIVWVSVHSNLSSTTV